MVAGMVARQREKDFSEGQDEKEAMMEWGSEMVLESKKLVVPLPWP